MQDMKRWITPQLYGHILIHPGKRPELSCLQAYKPLQHYQGFLVVLGVNILNRDRDEICLQLRV